MKKIRIIAVAILVMGTMLSKAQTNSTIVKKNPLQQLVDSLHLTDYSLHDEKQTRFIIKYVDGKKVVTPYCERIVYSGNPPKIKGILKITPRLDNTKSEEAKYVEE